MATLAPVKFYIPYLNSPTRKTFYYVINSSISCTELKLVQFWLILPEFGCHGNYLGSLEILVSIFEFTAPENLTIRAKKSSISCADLKSVQFCFFCSNLVAMATLLAHLKILLAYWNSPAPKSRLYMRTIPRFLAEKWWVQFFGPNLVAMATALTPMKFYISYSNSPTRKPFNYVINSSISCTELKLVQFWLIFAQISLPS